MFLEYLKSQYKTNEPIFASDIDLPLSASNLRQMFKCLCDKGLLKRYDDGIYYLPSDSILNSPAVLSSSKVIRYKYISRRGEVNGFYSGFSFANLIGLSSQVPYAVELVSNSCSAKYREVMMKNQKVILRSPKVKINSENRSVLQFLDLLKDVEKYSDYDLEKTAEILKKYIRSENIRRNDVDKFITLYPEKVYKPIYEMRLYDVFA